MATKSKTGKRGAGKSLLMALSYVAYIFLVIEVGCRLAFGFLPLLEKIRTDDDSSHRLYWVQRHADGANLYYDFDIYDPLLGWALKPGIRDKTVFGNKILNSNSRGLRGLREFDYSKPEDKTRVLILGDSFTFGDEVSDDETYPHYLQEMLPQTEVINMGIHGFGHDQMLLYFQNEGVKYNPDIVVLGFVSFDMKRNLLKFRDFAKPKFELTSKGLRLTNNPVPSPRSVMLLEPFRSKAWDVFSMLWHRFLWKAGVQDAQMEKLTWEILKEMKASIEDIGAIPLYIYLPTELDFEDYFDRPTEGEALFLDFCEREEIACTSARPRFIEVLKGGGQFDIYGHWGHQGQEFAAQVIRSYLIDHDMVP